VFYPPHFLPQRRFQILDRLTRAVPQTLDAASETAAGIASPIRGIEQGDAGANQRANGETGHEIPGAMNELLRLVSEIVIEGEFIIGHKGLKASGEKA